MAKWFDSSISKSSANSFQSTASTLTGSEDEDRLQIRNAVVDCSDFVSPPDSDQMLLKQAFRSSVVTKKTTAKAWLRDRKNNAGPTQSTESISAQQLPGAVSKD
uniref:Uncharacterized protein n=1 Tax=Cryptomonas curvata TaxID=233186 RepID=A0A7S0QGT6_9CRYP